MQKLLITGGTPLSGQIHISGAKNAALPLLCCSLLSDEPLTLSNMPDLADIKTMRALLEQHGVEIRDSRLDNPASLISSIGSRISLNGHNVHNLTAPYELVRTMRASILVLGPLLARHGAAKVSLPGGCAIGTRPVDMHLSALEKMGATIELVDGYVHAHVEGEHLKGANIDFDIVSVGATENILMAASLARGTTRITNAAQEPEITNLAECLIAMGARVSGLGTSTLTIEGVEQLHAAEHAVIADRIEAGSFACAAAITGGKVELIGARAEHLAALIKKLEEAGVDIKETRQGLMIQRTKPLKPVSVATAPHPAFPTDMQAQLMALMTLADGTSQITETIFENRFMHVPELVRMGANIHIDGHTATIKGVCALKGAEVMATDLRASFSLVIAALAAQGETTIHRLYHLDRGYEKLVRKLAGAGANIQRVDEDTEVRSSDKVVALTSAL